MGMPTPARAVASSQCMRTSRAHAGFLQPFALPTAAGGSERLFCNPRGPLLQHLHAGNMRARQLHHQSVAPSSPAAAAGDEHSQSTEFGLLSTSEAPLPLRAAFAAQPSPSEPPPKRRWGPWLKVSLFGIISVSPFVGAAFLFKSLMQQRQEEQATAMLAAADTETALRTAQQLVSRATTCVCIAGGAKGGRIISTAVEPHLPETRVLRLPTKDVIEGIPNNALTYLLAGERGSFSLPFNFVHFGISASSALLSKVTAGESLALLYVDSTSGGSVLLTGVAAVLDLPAYKAHYWRNCWEPTLPGGSSSPDYKLIKFVPSSIAIDLPSRGKAKWKPIKLSRIITEESIYWALDDGGAGPAC
ncbi:uncharacterized protein LOC34622959 [Cyclospora cayetanensis]|uniref:Uncharacterized protein LOC34622959 n=1 Tax=Cyclospora cayetanensis TaxID=88456 RepID=A0A6P6RYT4_9EIME|nr:uncharacterized protein LOC34622959 [Cyclospora cayetanensis]